MALDDLVAAVLDQVANDRFRLSDYHMVCVLAGFLWEKGGMGPTDDDSTRRVERPEILCYFVASWCCGR